MSCCYRREQKTMLMLLFIYFSWFDRLERLDVLHVQILVHIVGTLGALEVARERAFTAAARVVYILELLFVLVAVARFVVGEVMRRRRSTRGRRWWLRCWLLQTQFIGQQEQLLLVEFRMSALQC